jgi:hypothetical protein
METATNYGSWPRPKKRGKIEIGVAAKGKAKQPRGKGIKNSRI